MYVKPKVQPLFFFFLIFSSLLSMMILFNAPYARSLQTLIFALSHEHYFTFAPMETSSEIWTFVSGFTAITIVYLFSLAYLPNKITYTYIITSTFILGIAYTFLPIVTSQDIFSYIAYARMQDIYHLNPLITLPTLIHQDAVYPYLYWTRQPSAYGPTWIWLTSMLQWSTMQLGGSTIFTQQLLLRWFGLSMHLASVQLIWSICTVNPLTTPEQQSHRVRGTLAFAWNPFLLLEACINAHSDTTILFILLLAIQVLYRQPQRHRGMFLVTTLFAVAACIKISLLLLFPGYLLYLWSQKATYSLWQQRLELILAHCCLYSGIILVLYAPFWQFGELLTIVKTSPVLLRTINSPYESLTRIIDHLTGRYRSQDIDQGSLLERQSHQISAIFFCIIYGYICVQSVRHSVVTPSALVRWLATVWLLYCFAGSPWFWPWYTTTFFGLAALIEAEGKPYLRMSAGFFALFIRLLSISMLSFYSFNSWSAESSLPFLPHIRWMYVRGIWIWLPSLLIIIYAAYLSPWIKVSSRQLHLQNP
ncbi:hypothetical protein [Tengunoibacter tsumagoiensis]|nr:hypothetical protein [Tengunoibacter tsumagoiensis]